MIRFRPGDRVEISGVAVPLINGKNRKGTVVGLFANHHTLPLGQQSYMVDVDAPYSGHHGGSGLNVPSGRGWWVGGSFLTLVNPLSPFEMALKEYICHELDT